MPLSSQSTTTPRTLTLLVPLEVHPTLTAPGIEKEIKPTHGTRYAKRYVCVIIAQEQVNYMESKPTTIPTRLREL